MKDTSAIYSFRGVRQPVWVFGVILVCLALFSSLEAYQLSGYESMSVLAPLEKEMATMMYAEDESELNADTFAEDASMIDLAQSVGISKYSQHCTSDKLNSLRKPWDNAIPLAKDRVVTAAEEKLSSASKELARLKATPNTDAKKIATAQKKVDDAPAAITLARDDAQKALAAFNTKYAGTASPEAIRVEDDDLVCYYASREYNLKGFKEKGDATCKDGFKLSSPPITSTKLSDQQLKDIKKKIFDLVAASTTNVQFDVATLHSVEVVPRTSSNQRVILFLLDREKGCAYPVAHVVIPETAKVPHTEKILADLNMFSRDMMVDIAATHYKIDTTKTEKFSSILYSYYAPCEDCSKVVIDTWKNEADNFGRHSVLYNQAQCNGKSYEAQHQRLCMVNADDAHRHASQQVLRDVPTPKSGAPPPTADRNPISAFKTGEETAELAIEAYKEAVKKKESTEDAKKLALSAVESVATACYYAEATKKAVTTEIADTENKRAKHNSGTKPYNEADARIARLQGDLNLINKKPYASHAKTIIQNILKVNVLSQNEVLTKFAEFNADSDLAKELVTSSTSATASTSNTQQGTVTRTQQSTLTRTSSNLAASSPAKNPSKGGTIRKKRPVSTDSESEDDFLRQINKDKKNKRQKF